MADTFEEKLPAVKANLISIVSIIGLALAGAKVIQHEALSIFVLPSAPGRDAIDPVPELKDGHWLVEWLRRNPHHLDTLIAAQRNNPNLLASVHTPEVRELVQQLIHEVLEREANEAIARNGFAGRIIR